VTRMKNSPLPVQDNSEFELWEESDLSKPLVSIEERFFHEGVTDEVVSLLLRPMVRR
jgi:hypothetical protein